MKKRIFLMATIIALISVMAYGQNAKKYYKAGTDFIENKRYEDAADQFTRAIELEPANADYYHERGKAYDLMKRYTEAKADFEKAMVFDEKNMEIIISLGRVNYNMGNYEEALKLLNYASSVDKRNKDVYPLKVLTLIELRRFEQALRVSDTAIIIKDTPVDYFQRGLIYRGLNNDAMARKEFEKSISKDKKYAEPRLALADLLINIDPTEAMNQCNEVIKNNDRNTDAYLVRSRVYMKNLDYPNAINDISKNILIDPDNPEYYLERGYCYQKFNQHTNAINDFSKYISLRQDNPEAFFARAKSYEEIMSYDKAMVDYGKITVLSEFNMEARKMLKDAQERLYELNRETVPPEITIVSPVPGKETIEIKGDKAAILISGKIKESSKIKSFSINNGPVAFTEQGGEYEFLSNIDVSGVDKLTFVARDEYDNEKALTYSIIRTEINPPTITIVSPFSQGNIVFLDTPTPNIAIQGKISDDSKINSITVGNIRASYDPTGLNPSFSANLDISNLNKFTIVAEDIYGNRQETEYTINRDGSSIAENNPMGRTWVVFIENSSYTNFAALDGPIKDVSTIQRALANYQIHQVIHKQDMTKMDMDRYFNIELRDLVKKNQVKSLLVWYAGHGKYINDIGYWIPVDAKRDDEFTYYNINNLKAALQSYSDVVVHTLVISDACETGQGFYTAMRAAGEAPTCDNSLVAGAPSAQVFASANTQLATDNSKFTATFANTLLNNTNACIPIETIVNKVKEAVENDKGQVPKFGKIVGLEDMNGTFFFIAK